MTLTILIFLLIFSISIFFMNSKETSKWLGFIIFLGFLFVLVHYLDSNHIIPFGRLSIVDTFYTYIYPYCFLMLSISLYDFKNMNLKKWTYFIFLLPTLIFYYIDPTGRIFYEYVLHHKVDYPLFFIQFLWAGIYIITANILLILKIIRETHHQSRVENYKLASLFVPSSLIVLFIGYYSPLQYSNAICNTQLYFIGIMLGILIFLFSIVGFYGIKFKIEKYSFENTKRVLNYSTSIINHTIKNEIQKLSACSEIIQVNKDPKNLDVVAKIISNSTQHLSAMINQIQAQLTDIALIKSEVDLNTVINKSLEMFQPSFVSKNIKITKNFNCETFIHGDETHLKEVFINIFNNAVEAMNEGGELTIDGLKKKKEIVITITDTGKGISSDDLSHVFDLFFTTKGKGNYGLGLCYCYNVIKKHGGNITIQSKENVGTTLMISLPLK